MRRPPRSPLFPHPTLFRSDPATIDTFQALGAATQQINFSELYVALQQGVVDGQENPLDRKSTRLNSSHANISYAVFCLKKKKNPNIRSTHCVWRHQHCSAY